MSPLVIRFLYSHTRSVCIRHRSLGSNRFTGTLINLSDFFNVSIATEVDLSNNELSGPLLPNLKASDLGSIQKL